MLESSDDALDAIWIVVGVMLLWTGRQAFGALLSGGWVGVLVVTQLFVTGIAVVAAGVTDVDLRRWGRPLAGWVVYTLGVLGVFTWMVVDPMHFASDVALFESWSANLLLDGQNPMSADMLQAREQWAISNSSANVTQTLGGSEVSSYSYPGGSLWVSTLEVAVTQRPRVGLSYVLLSTGLLGYLVWRVDAIVVPLALLVWIAPVSRTANAAFGQITAVWLVPLTIGLALWYDGRLDGSAVALGVAAAAKQLAWPIAGLVWLHIWRTDGRRAALRTGGIAAGVAVLFVAPFVVWDISAWLESALVPLGEPLVAQGVGLTSLTVGGVATVPRTLHRVLVGAVALGLVGAVWLRPRSMHYLIPFATIAVMLVHYRTLPSYYHSALPLAVVAFDDRIRGELS